MFFSDEAGGSSKVAALILKRPMILEQWMMMESRSCTADSSEVERTREKQFELHPCESAFMYG